MHCTYKYSTKYFTVVYVARHTHPHTHTHTHQAPSRPLDNAIERLPQSSAPSLPPTHSTSPLRPNGKVVQYVEIDVTSDRPPAMTIDHSASANSLNHLSGRESPDTTYAEIDKEGKKIPAYAEVNKFRKSGYAGIRKVSSSPDMRRRSAPNYAEIEVRNLSELVNEESYAEIDVKDEPVKASDERVMMKMAGRPQKRRRHFSLHEELLEFIGEEWADLSLKKVWAGTYSHLHTILLYWPMYFHSSTCPVL